MTATATDWIGRWPVLIEVHLPESDGTEAVIGCRAPVVSVSHLRKSVLPAPLDLRCDVVGRDDDRTCLVRLGHGVTDQRGRDTFRVDAAAVRPESPGEAFDRLLLNHHVDPENVTDVEMAWLTFTEFAQTEIDGVDPEPDSDADGVIIGWGRHSWNGGAATLTFTRQVALITDGSPVLWQASLEIRFAGFHILPAGNTGWDFTPPGPRRAAALAALRAANQDRPQFHALWHAPPDGSTLTCERVVGESVTL